jgi:cysteine desulfurase/selenocysteine lyase
VSFYFDDCHSSDIGSVLDQQGIAVRVGHLCTQPLLKKLNLTSVARASFSVFTTEKDMDALVAGLLKAREILT